MFVNRKAYFFTIFYIVKINAPGETPNAKEIMLRKEKHKTRDSRAEEEGSEAKSTDFEISGQSMKKAFTTRETQ